MELESALSNIYEKKMEYIVVFVTASSSDEAQKISLSLIEKKLIACSNIVAPVKSIFFWENKICTENEVLMILKSTRQHMAQIISEVKKLHSYQVPEIIALPIIAGAEDYLQWISNETK